MVTKVLIFDCDGVMFDSRDANIAYYNHILSLLGLPIMTQEEITFVHASTAPEALRYLLTRRDPLRLEQALAQRLGMDYTPFIHLMRIEPSLMDLLRSLPRGIKRTISTNRGYTMADVLRIHGLQDEFDLVVSAMDVENPKPHPEPVLKILHYFSISPSEALFIGDSDVDQQSARQAMVPFIAYKNRTLQADYYIDELSAIKTIISQREGGYASPVS